MAKGLGLGGVGAFSKGPSAQILCHSWVTFYGYLNSIRNKNVHF